MRFSRHLGELDWAPVAAARVKVPGEDRYVEVAPEGRQYVMVISNVIEDGQPIGQLGAYEAIWHTDMSYVDEPPSASALYSLEVPPSGGDTGFCNMYLAYETLPAELRRQVEGRRCRHDASRNSAGELRRGFVDAPDPTQTVGAEHPIVRTHPVTGKKALFLGRRRNAYIVGLPLEESEALLDALWAHCTKPEFDLVSAVARRRSDPVGQSLRHAPARCVRPGDAARHAPHPDQGGPPVVRAAASGCDSPARSRRGRAERAASAAAGSSPPPDTARLTLNNPSGIGSTCSS